MITVYDFILNMFTSTLFLLLIICLAVLFTKEKESNKNFRYYINTVGLFLTILLAAITAILVFAF